MTQRKNKQRSSIRLAEDSFWAVTRRRYRLIDPTLRIARAVSKEVSEPIGALYDAGLAIGEFRRAARNARRGQ